MEADRYNGLRIERIRDISEVLKCLPMERQIRKKGRDKTRESDMLMFFSSQMENPNFAFWIAYNGDGGVVGYTATLLSLFPGLERLHLIRMYCKTKQVRETFEDLLTQMAKAFRVKVVQITANKNIKAMKRYGFKPVSVNMERRV